MQCRCCRYPSRVGSVRPATDRLRPPDHRQPRREDLRGVRPRELGPHLVLVARDMTGYRSLCRLASAAHLAGTKGAPRFTSDLVRRNAEGLLCLSGCRHGEVARRLLAGDRTGAEQAAQAHGRMSLVTVTSSSSCSTTCCPTTTGWSPKRSRSRPRHQPAHGGHQRRALRASSRIASCRTCWCASATARRSTKAPICAGRTASTTSSRQHSWPQLPPGRGDLGEDVAQAWAEGISHGGRGGGSVFGRLRLRAVPLSGLSGPVRRDGFLHTSRACATRACAGATCRSGRRSSSSWPTSWRSSSAPAWPSSS